MEKKPWKGEQHVYSNKRWGGLGQCFLTFQHLSWRSMFVFLNFQSARTNTFLKFINIELLEKWSCDIEVSKNSLSISVHCSSRTRKEQVTDCQQAARHTWSSTGLGNGLRWNSKEVGAGLSRILHTIKGFQPLCHQNWHKLSFCICIIG